MAGVQLDVPIQRTKEVCPGLDFQDFSRNDLTTRWELPFDVMPHQQYEIFLGCSTGISRSTPANPLRRSQCCSTSACATRADAA
jgi:hypothetical protein